MFPATLPLLIPAIVLRGGHPGIHVFGSGMIDQGAAAHDVPAICAAVVNEHLGVILHLLNRTRCQQGVRHVSHEADRVSQHFFGPYEIRAFKMVDAFPLGNFPDDL